MSDDRKLLIKRDGESGFVRLYGDQSCSPEVGEVMLTIGINIREPARPGKPRTLDDLLRGVWWIWEGPWTRWSIHRSHVLDATQLRAPVQAAADVLRRAGYDVEVRPSPVGGTNP